MKWTIHKASMEWGVDKKTLATALRGSGHELSKGKEFTTREVNEALFGDDKKERTRESKARADLLERERAELDKVTVRLDEVQKMLSEAMLLVRQRFIALASECANRCNPVDPKLARDALQRWSDDALAAIRSELPKVKK